MTPEILKRFHTLFQNQKESLVFSKQIINEDFQINTEDLKDELDLATSELENGMRMRLRNREALFLKKIEEALSRIQAGTFGECEDCNEPIDLKRLEARPTTTSCISCKEDQERREWLHIDGHRHKSLGKKLKLA